MKNQNDINHKMRGILIDWLVEVHHKFKLHVSTLWLCVNIIDRFLEKEKILRAKLQLVGVTALLIACKIEEIYPPEVRDCVYITDYAYDRDEVLKMEVDILTALNYDLVVPTGFHFLIRYLTHIKASEHTKCLAHYYSERNMQEADFLKFKPHVVAASCVYLALKQQAIHSLSNEQIWHKSLVEETGLLESDLVECASKLIKHVGEEAVTSSKRKLIAAKKKYGQEKFLNVAALEFPVISAANP